jgi:allantoinase
MSPLIIKCTKAVIGNEVKEAFVVIKNGVIGDVLSSIDYDVTDKLMDAGDSVLMPGVIDPHVHINEPGRTEWEGFETATRAAITGGITTLVDMPLNSSLVTTTLKNFEKKLLAAQNQLYANCGFWGGIVPGNEDEIEPLIEKGVLGFKAFLTHSGIDDFPNVDEDVLRKAMPIIAKHHLPLLVHCELSTNEFRQTNPESYRQYLASRPKEWEDNAIALMIRLCEAYNCPVHVVHLSSANSIEQIRKAKEKGLPLTVETAQHYLYFNAEEIQDGHTEFKCAPPIRETENNEELWQALQDGIIDFVATDHSPAPPQLKEIESRDFTKAWGGIASLQFALPILWTAARQRNISIADVSKWLSTNPSKITGLQKRKGKIAKGYDADLVIVNAEKSFEVKENMILHKHKLTPYIHEQLYGLVEASFLKGEKVFEHSSLLKKKGTILLNQQ